MSLLGSLLELDSGVEVFRVLADDDQVDVLVPRPDAGVALAGTHLAVEVERLPQRHVDRAEARAHRGRDRPLDGDAVFLDRVEDRVGQRIAAVLVHDVGARLADVPLEDDPRRLEDAPGRVGDLGPGPVTGDERDAVSHRQDSSEACSGRLRVDCGA